MKEEMGAADEFEGWIDELHNKNIILDLGGGTPFQGKIKKEKLKPHTKYYCMDFCADFKPHMLGDIQKLPFKDKSVDSIYCGAVLEHVPEPWTAIKEIHRVLADKGVVVVYIPFMFPYHGGKEFKDYYRFSIDAIRYLFRDFSEVSTSASGTYVNTTLRFMAGFMPAQRFLLRYEKFISKFFKKLFAHSIEKYPYRYSGLRKSTTGHGVYAMK
jgi:ubiquinone/menaquinone biosynthesis C-methylase UbiE